MGLYELRTKVRLGGIYKGLYIFLGGTFKEYTITLIQGLCGDFRVSGLWPYIFYREVP